MRNDFAFPADPADPAPHEPTDVGPAFGGDVPATDADRRQVVTLLRAAFAEGHLSAQECDTRVAVAQSAATFDDLVPLTRDLLDARAAGASSSAHPLLLRPAVDTANANDHVEQFVAIFSSVNRAGHWRVRRTSNALALFGGVELDLSEAVFEGQTVTLNMFVLFGGVVIVVPVGCEVRDSVIAVFGGTDRKKLAPPVAGMPSVEVRGLVGFGGVEIRNPKGPKAKR